MRSGGVITNCSTQVFDKYYCEKSDLYNLSGSKCVKKTSVKAHANYYCRSGYKAYGSGSAMLCYK